MLWVGLTGGIGTGKSSVTRILRQQNIPVIDADELAREVVKAGSPGYKEVLRVFGPIVSGEDGELNRKEIGRQVFSDSSKLALLEGIIHPLVRKLSMQKKIELESAGVAVAFYDVPLLFEKKMEDLFDRIVVVTCDFKIQKQRLIERDGFSEEEATRRIAAQLPLQEKIRAAHFTIHNEGSLLDLEKKVSLLIAQLRQL